jgi:hypothetical protein
MLAAKYQLAFKDIYEFRLFMGMKGKSCARLKSNNLHLQPIGDAHILNRDSSEET